MACMTPSTAQREAPLKPGAVVRCRTRRYLVEEVVPPPEAGGDTVVTLACMEDQSIGERLTVFREREIDFERLAESSWEAVTQRGFDDPRQFAAYRNTLRWNCVTATDAESRRPLQERGEARSASNEAQRDHIQTYARSA